MNRYTIIQFKSNGGWEFKIARDDLESILFEVFKDDRYYVVESGN